MGFDQHWVGVGNLSRCLFNKTEFSQNSSSESSGLTIGRREVPEIIAHPHIQPHPHTSYLTCTAKVRGGQPHYFNIRDKKTRIKKKELTSLSSCCSGCERRSFGFRCVPFCSSPTAFESGHTAFSNGSHCVAQITFRESFLNHGFVSVRNKGQTE